MRSSLGTALRFCRNFTSQFSLAPMFFDDQDHLVSEMNSALQQSRKGRLAVLAVSSHLGCQSSLAVESPYSCSGVPVFGRHANWATDDCATNFRVRVTVRVRPLGLPLVRW